MKHLSQESLLSLIKSKRPSFATMASAHLPLTTANVIKCNLVPPELTGREVADDLMPFARALARRWVEQKPNRRKAIELPRSVDLPVFIFVERTEANRKLQKDTELTPFPKATARGKADALASSGVEKRQAKVPAKTATEQDPAT